MSLPRYPRAREGSGRPRRPTRRVIARRASATLWVMPSTPSRGDDILPYGFTTERDPRVIAARQAPLWWGKGSDDELRARFGADHQRALRGELAAWAETARGRLALIILLDQLSRSIHRGSAASFAG